MKNTPEASMEEEMQYTRHILVEEINTARDYFHAKYPQLPILHMTPSDEIFLERLESDMYIRLKQHESEHGWDDDKMFWIVSTISLLIRGTYFMDIKRAIQNLEHVHMMVEVIMEWHGEEKPTKQKPHLTVIHSEKERE